MEELHIEEGDVLGTEETWAGDYDIAEDEEERLLEEHEVQDEQEALGYYFSHFSDHRNSNNNGVTAAAAAAAAQRCFINPHYKGSVHAPVQGNHHQHHQQQQNRMMLVATNELGPCFVQPPVGMFRDRPLPNVMPNFRFPPPVQNVLPPPRINAPPAAQRFAYPVGNPLTPVRELFKKRSSTSPRRWERDEEKDNIQMRKAEFV